MLFFFWQSPLNEHQPMCAEDRLCGSAVCPKELNHQYDTEAHQHGHSLQQPYACDVCKKTFVRKGDINRHQVIHSGQ